MMSVRRMVLYREVFGHASILALLFRPRPAAASTVAAPRSRYTAAASCRRVHAAAPHCGRAPATSGPPGQCGTRCDGGSDGGGGGSAPSSSEEGCAVTLPHVNPSSIPDPPAVVTPAYITSRLTSPWPVPQPSPVTITAKPSPISATSQPPARPPDD